MNDAGSHTHKTGIWDLKTSQQIIKLEKHSNLASDACFHPTEPIVATVSWDKNLHLSDTRTGELIQIINNVSQNYVSVNIDNSLKWNVDYDLGKSCCN